MSAAEPRYLIVGRCHPRSGGPRCDTPGCPKGDREITSTDSPARAAEVAKNWAEYDARVVDRLAADAGTPALTAAGTSARATLVKAAVEIVRYVADGNVATADLVKQFGLTEQEARWLLSANAASLVSEIKTLGPK